MIEAVLFDMDGLLVDTERIYAAVTRQTVREMGYEPKEDVILRSMGLPAKSWQKFVQENYGPDFDSNFFLKRVNILKDQWQREKGVPRKKGALELLCYLEQKGIPKAVASSSYREGALETLRLAGLEGRFEAGVFGDMVENGKPAPDIFLKAAQQLGKSPEKCMGLEDSQNGIRACYAAGLFTVLVPDLAPVTPEILSLADRRVDSLLDVIPLLEQMENETAKDEIKCGY